MTAPDPFQILEFDQVLSAILKYAKTSPGIEHLKLLRPSGDAYYIRNSLGLVREMRDYLKFIGIMEFIPSEDIGDSLDASVKEGVLLGILEILEIKKTLTNYYRNVTAIQAEKERYPNLSARFLLDGYPEALIKQIARIMDDDGVIFDHASEELKRIRKRKSSIRGEISGKLNAIMNGSGMEGVIQDRIITIRDGRFVIPLRSQYKNKVKSEMNYIVHSFSKTGETAFVEPEPIIILNNEIVEIDEQEMEEIRRILRELTSEIGKAADVIRSIRDELGVLESVYARARFALDRKCGFPEILEGQSSVKLVNAKHPLLGPDSVPVDIEVGFSFQGMVISGPNAGGKTVALKTTGLLTLMAQSGIPIPASDQSKIGLFDAVLAEIGDEQSISENLSSFSGHILNISGILTKSSPKTLVLIDEIASSTEPKEGEALGREIIRELLDKGARFIITTHFQGIKQIGYSDERVRNAFVEFDEEKLVPLYRLSMNGTGSSYALKVARKYGLSEKVISSAEKFIEENISDTEKALKTIENERNMLFSKKGLLAKQMNQLRSMKEKYEELVKELEEQKEKIEKKSISVLKQDLDNALREISSLKAELKKKNALDFKEADRKIESAQTVLKVTELERMEKVRKHPGTIEPGMKVFVGTYEKEGTVESVKENKVKVRIGIISTVVEKSELFESLLKPEPSRKKYGVPENLNVLPYILDLRGMLMEEAVKTVEKNLDLAVMNGVNCLHIIHGKGEGILRKGVWDFLRTQDYIKSYDYAKPEEGGQGKTIVYLK